MLLTSLLFLLGGLGGPAAALCISKNHHIAIELLAGGSCESGSHSPSSTTQPHENDTDGSDCCQDCSDIALKLEESCLKRSGQDYSLLPCDADSQVNVIESLRSFGAVPIFRIRFDQLENVVSSSPPQLFLSTIRLLI